MINSLRLFFTVFIFIFLANAQGAETQNSGGIGLNKSRIIIQPNEKQTMLGVRNTSKTQHFLVQSFVETFSRQKVNDLIITPPLFVMKPMDENTLRIINTGVKMPDDRETLYWVSVKAIPSSASEEKGNSLKIAIQNRIRLLVRPEGLTISVSEAPGMLQFRRTANELIVNNPTPYYLSLVNFKVGSTRLNSETVEPFKEMRLPLPTQAKGDVSVQTVNDYGSWTPVIKRAL
ncbi:fimbria/pilus periplasmic chaperone [Enterobacter sp. ENT03]|uniref:fimbria/pilus periplasmic chaperone n=1 Tax=Enterobacter sp. ENT03 TaxID=2854780 RepID=UPI001C438064|nr:fimbria/pilus periplasmic chaperone [Enterobacter sp. ENT03]MBV7403494.1 fimbria/pilus periplasmic chaperone [Enterobacter sp. ENT03]